MALLAGCREPVDLSGWDRDTDLIALFAAAEVTSEPGRIDLGTPEARSWLRSGWSKDEGDGAGRTYVWSEGTESEMEFFLAAPRDLPLSFRAGPFRYPGSPTQVVTVVANGRDLAEVPLAPDPREYRVALPEEALRPGLNRLAFRYAWTRSPAEVGGGSGDARRLAVSWEELSFGAGGQAGNEPRVTRDELYIPFGSRVSYYAEPSAGAALLLDRLRARGGEAAKGGTLEVVLLPEDGRRRVAARLEPGDRPAAVPLGGDRQPVRVSLVAVPGSSQADGSGAGLVLRRPAFARPAGLRPGEGASGGAPNRRDRARRPNVVVYLVDTLRADRLGAYGYPKPVSPHLDAFARRATLFENAVAQSPWTRPSVASLFTGVWPRTHGVNGRRDSLSPDALTLAEMLLSQGWRTAAFVTNGNVARQFGIGQGFEEFTLLRRNRNGSESVTEDAAAWLERRAEQGDDRPFFLYLHTVDPHSSYAPPPDLRARFAPDVPRDGTGARWWLKRLEHGRIPVTPKLVENLLALYDAEIAANDRSFGAFLKALQRFGLWDDTVVVFVSDHGEEFFEHGGWEHGKTLHTEMLDVPLVVRFPGMGEGRRVVPPVQHIDFVPTLLAYAGLPEPPQVEGRNLLPLVSGKGVWGTERGAAGEAVYSYLDVDGHQAASATTLGWRMIETRAPRAGARLYDRRQDPGERRDRAGAYAVRAGLLRSLLRERESRQGHRLEAGEGQLDDELREQLRALGYID